MLRKTIIFGICIGTSASIPIIYQTNPDAVMALVQAESTTTVEIESGVPRAGNQAAPKSSGISGRKIEIAADPRGHFLGDFKMNGRSVEALIDTGATSVALNLSTARRLGIKVSASDMKGMVTTANGRTRATSATIDRVDIGRISVDNVQALILDDDSLDVVLVGMSFLNRLKKFEVDQGTLVLVQ